MVKKTLKPNYRALWLAPTATVLVSCTGKSATPNIITIAAYGVFSSSPLLLGIAIGVNQYSLRLIKETGDFVVNVPSHEQAHIADLCGSFSGRHINKFSEFNLTPGRSIKVKSPYIVECPINIECTLWKSVNCGNHELLLGEIQMVHIDEEILSEDGMIEPSKFNPLVSFQSEYWSLGKRINKWHYTVKS